jgi:hypothetical protein
MVSMLLTLLNDLLEGQIKEAAVGEKCNAHGGHEKLIHCFSWKIRRKQFILEITL